KFQAFSQIVASAVRLELVDTSGAAPATNTRVVSLQSPATLLSLVNGPYTPTALGRSAWVAVARRAGRAPRGGGAPTSTPKSRPWTCPSARRPRAPGSASSRTTRATATRPTRPSG